VSIHEKLSADLAMHFAGTWMTFHPGGTYSDEYEASYSGNLTDGSGNVTGDWETMGQDSGKEVYYEYRVNLKDGRKYYWENYFNGDFFS
jgi:hypothetical protein